MKGLAATALKTICTTALMALAAAAVLKLMDSLTYSRWHNVIRLLAVVPTAAAYVLAAKLLRIEVLSLLTATRQDPPGNLS